MRFNFMYFFLKNIDYPVKSFIKYSLFFIFCLFIIYSYFDYNKNLKNEQVSELYIRAVNSFYVSDYNTVVNLSKLIIKNYDNVCYKEFCFLLLSNIKYKKNDIFNSIFFLKEIVNNNSYAYLSHMSIVRLCKIFYLNNMLNEAFYYIDNFKNDIYFSLY